MSGVRQLPFHDFALYQGIASNMRPEDLAGQYLITAQNVDSFDQFRSLGKIPGSTRVSDDHGAVVKSLHMYEFLDLFGDLNKVQLSFAADGVLRKINSDLTLTSLKTGMESGVLRGAEMLNRLHLTGPEQVSLPTGGIKYDGTQVTNWGVVGPGLTPTTIQSLDDNTDWTASTDADLDDNSHSQDGGGGISIAKTGTSTSVAYLERAGLGLNLSALGQNTLFVYLFLPYGTLQKLATSGSAVSVILGGSGLTNYDQHNFSVGELIPGWNLLSMDVTDPDSETGSGATLTAIDTIRLQLNTSSSAITFSGVVWDYIFSQANGTVTVAVGAAGATTGTYRYKVSFLTEYGVESNGGPTSGSVTTTADKVTITNIPVSTDTQVIARRIYRDISGDGIWRFVDQIDDNVTTSYTDDIVDASLGEPTLPLLGDSELDNAPPGRLKAMVIANNRLIGISADDPYRIIISDVNGPETARLVDQLVVEESLEAIENHGLGTLLYASDAIYQLSGDGVEIPFRVDKVTNRAGSNGFRSLCSIKNIHMVVRENEVFLVANPANPWFLGKLRLDHFRNDIPAATRGDTFLVEDRSRFRVVLFSKGSSGDYDQIDVWQFGVSGQEQVSADGPGIDPQDSRIGAWLTMSLPSSINPQCAEIVERTEDSPELWVGGEDGYVYWLQDPSKTSWAEAASTAAVDAIFETAAVPLGAGPAGRGEPRALQVNAEASAQTDWTVTITLLSDADGDEITSSSFTVTLGAGNTSPVIPIPSIGARGEWCRVKLRNNTSAGVGIIKSLRLYYIPRGDFRGPRSS